MVPCSHCSGCLSCLAVPLLLVCCARPCPSWCGSRVLCVCVAPPPVCWRSWVPLSRTPSCPTRLPPCMRISHLHTTWTVPCAVGWSRPCCHPRGGHLPAHGAQPPPLWSTWEPRGVRGHPRLPCQAYLRTGAYWRGCGPTWESPIWKVPIREQKGVACSLSSAECFC